MHVPQVDAPHEPIHEEDVGVISHSPPHVHESAKVMTLIDPIYCVMFICLLTPNI